jgi:UDP-2-acetamido-2,6-beta-L-arabino-hexul-4-ose reductase
MIKIGITGQNGFVGSHLYNTLKHFGNQYEIIPFDRNWFSDPTLLGNFVNSCQVIVHLAALNRHNDASAIETTNVELVKQLINACKQKHAKPHIIISSSTQEALDNPYGRSKKIGKELLMQWATETNSACTALIIPNVFGAFGHPFYNSVVATFCHQLTHGQLPKIEKDAELSLIYIDELVKIIIEQINKSQLLDSPQTTELKISPTKQIKVSVILELVSSYYNSYFKEGKMPNLQNEFERNLFVTFLSFIDFKTFFPFKLKNNTDQRGNFVEIIRLQSGGQVSFSTTHAGITRGNHYHTRKVERFAVIKGEALIQLRKVNTTQVLEFLVNGNEPSFVDMPIWHTHNITNVGKEELLTIFWINEPYNENDADTFFETV